MYHKSISMQARPVRSAWRLQKTSVPAANSSRTDGMIKSSFFIGRTSSSNILSQVGTQKNLTVRRISGRARTSPHDREARASGLLWFAPLGCHTSAGWLLSRPSQCAHWLALRPMRQHRPALTADSQRKIFPRRGANFFNVRFDSHSVTGPAA